MPKLEDLARQYRKMVKDSLQLIFDELNKGQTQKLLKNEEIRKLVEQFDIEHK